MLREYGDFVDVDVVLVDHEDFASFAVDDDAFAVVVENTLNRLK